MTAPSAQNAYDEAFQLVERGTGGSWMPSALFDKTLRVYAQVPDTLNANQRLYPGDTLTSSNSVYRFVLQGDGNLVIYHGGHAIWASRTNGKSPSNVVMQGDGNLVLYRAGGGVLWASRTNGNPGSRLLMQNDGNLVIYNSHGRPVWASHTNGK